MFRSARAMTPLFSALAALCALTAHATPPSYNLQPLQQTHADLVAPVPAVMNNNGQLAGYAYSRITQNQNLALWSDTVLTNAGDAPNWIISLIDMNDRGQVLGYSYDDARNIHGFVYQNGTYHAIPNFQYGYGINASGKVPYWNTAQEAFCLWDNGNSTPLPSTATINGQQWQLSEPFAINDNDEIAYIASSPLTGSPAIYVYGANPFALPAMNDYIAGWIIGMNNSRQIAGTCATGNEHFIPFLYSDNGTNGHGTYQFFEEGYQLRKLNERGEILAYKDDGDYAIFHDNAWHNLNDCVPAGWIVACTYDMNDKGEIAALVTHGVEQQLVILKPNASQSSSSLRGQITVPNPADRAVQITITGATTQTATATLNAQGQFTLPISIIGAATIRVKAANTLASQVTMTLVNGDNVLPTPITLRGGDANNDNVVDIADLLLLINAYNKTAPAAGYSQAADFDNNGTNDIADLLTLIGNYNQMGS